MSPNPKMVALFGVSVLVVACQRPHDYPIFDIIGQLIGVASIWWGAKYWDSLK